MKMSSKQKWSIVALVFVVSLVGLFTFALQPFAIAVAQMLASVVMLLASACYGICGMLDAKVFERFMEWLKTDDV